MEAGTTRIRAYDLATGKELWTCPGMTVNAIPSAVAGDGVVYVMSGYRGRVHFSASAGGVGLPADYTFTAGDKGHRTFTLTAPKVTGPVTITISDAASHLQMGFTVKVVPAAVV